MAARLVAINLLTAISLEYGKSKDRNVTDFLKSFSCSFNILVKTLFMLFYLQTIVISLVYRWNRLIVINIIFILGTEGLEPSRLSLGNGF